MREKLIELVNAVLRCLPWGEISSHTAEDVADHLIANGVTISKMETVSTDNNKWIPVTERLPEKREDVLLCRKWWGEISNPKMGWYNEVSGKWFDLSNMEIHNVTHWMPLPEPPKGETENEC